MVPAHRAGWGLKEIIYIMPSAQSLALSKSWLHLLSLPCQPHPGFLRSSTPRKVSRETSAPTSLGACEKRKCLHPSRTITIRMSGLGIQWPVWTGFPGRCACMVSLRGTHLEILLCDSSPWHSPALCPAPPHSWEQLKLQVWEETEVGSGKGLLTQYFRMDRQRVWRVVAHPCLQHSQWRGELKGISEYPCRKPGRIRQALEGRGPNPLRKGVWTCQPACHWMLLLPDQQLSLFHSSPFCEPWGRALHRLLFAAGPFFMALPLRPHLPSPANICLQCHPICVIANAVTYSTHLGNCKLPQARNYSFPWSLLTNGLLCPGFFWGLARQVRTRTTVSTPSPGDTAHWGIPIWLSFSASHPLLVSSHPYSFLGSMLLALYAPHSLHPPNSGSISLQTYSCHRLLPLIPPEMVFPKPLRLAPSFSSDLSVKYNHTTFCHPDLLFGFSFLVAFIIAWSYILYYHITYTFFTCFCHSPLEFKSSLEEKT